MNRKRGGLFLPFSIIFIFLSLVALLNIGRYNFEVEKNLLVDNKKSIVLDITKNDGMKLLEISEETGKNLQLELNGYNLKTFYDYDLHKWELKIEGKDFSKVFICTR